uniref:Uncharacterized protein n=1 Tax=Siphoviridae sp. ctHhH6 TaxID=2825422 RepID=A0A8S5QD00_9CAUD|nr:MAG TPA: hypothetical protein [Siphoviridae sp. ctHhH6]
MGFDNHSQPCSNTKVKPQFELPCLFVITSWNF